MIIKLLIVQNAHKKLENFTAVIPPLPYFYIVLCKMRLSVQQKQYRLKSKLIHINVVANH